VVARVLLCILLAMVFGREICYLGKSKHNKANTFNNLRLIHFGLLVSLHTKLQWCLCQLVGLALSVLLWLQQSRNDRERDMSSCVKWSRSNF